MKRSPLPKKTIEELNRILENFPEEKRKDFIREVSLLHSEYLHLKKYDSRTDRRKEINLFINHFEKSLKDLKKIAAGKSGINVQEKFSDMEGSKPFEIFNVEIKIVDLSSEIHDKIIDLLELIEKSEVLIKRRRSKDSTELVQKIAILYNNLIEKPSKTTDGKFSEIILAIQQVSSPKTLDVSGPVGKAIDSLGENSFLK